LKIDSFCCGFEFYFKYFYIRQSNKEIAMRRKDREITEKADLLKIVEKADVCRIAFAVDNEPYIVTLNFGFEWNENLVMYFHCAREGHKLEMLEQNSRVCFEMDVDHELITGETSCGYTMCFKSVVGYGKLTKVVSDEERSMGLNLLMEHYGAQPPFAYQPSVMSVTEILKLEVSEITGKIKAPKKLD
jgi:uncharacterized protein